MAITQAPFFFYDNGIKNLLKASDLLADDIKVALCASGYTPNAATHEFFDVSITNELPTNFGYTAGGQSLASKTFNSSGTAGEYVFDSTDPSWAVSTASLVAHYYVLYNNTPGSNKPLIGYSYLNYNGGTPQDVTTEPTFTLSILLPVTGWFKTSKTNGV